MLKITIDGQNRQLVNSFISKLVTDKICEFHNIGYSLDCCKKIIEDKDIIYVHNTCPYTFIKKYRLNINPEFLWIPDYVIYIYTDDYDENHFIDTTYDELTLPYKLYKINGNDDWYIVYAHICDILYHMQ